jgi:uncharacterized membrane protein
VAVKEKSELERKERDGHKVAAKAFKKAAKKKQTLVWWRVVVAILIITVVLLVGASVLSVIAFFSKTIRTSSRRT